MLISNKEYENFIVLQDEVVKNILVYIEKEYKGDEPRT